MIARTNTNNSEELIKFPITVLSSNLTSVVKFVELGGKALCVCHATRAEKDVTILSLTGRRLVRMSLLCR